MTVIEQFESYAEPAAVVVDQLYHAVVGLDGRWEQPFERIEAGVDDPTVGFVGASCADVEGELALVAVGTDGRLYHSGVDRDRRWRPFSALSSEPPDDRPREFYAAACAGGHGVLQLVAVGSDGRLYHSLRRRDGGWQDRFEVVESERLGGPEAFASVSCARAGDSLQLVALGAGGQLYHAVRDPDGVWWDFRSLGRTRLYDTPARFLAVDCAAIRGGSLQIVGAGADGRLYHTVRWPDGAWQRYFGVLGGQPHGGGLLFGLGVGCAGSGHALGVVAIGADNQLAYCTRMPDGSWRRSVRAARHRHGAPAVYQVSCAAIGDALHVVGGTWQGGFA
jgi:hypothetical protein